MKDYSKGRIYKLVCNVTGKVYYGHTISPLWHRKGRHKQDYINYLKGEKHYITSFDIIQGGNWDIILVENYPCKSIEELIAKERFYIENNECVNKIIPGRTDKEYYQDNKETILQQKKEYRKNNEETIRYKDKLRYVANQDIKIQKAKEYYNSNKETINEKRKETIECECGSNVSNGALHQHRKTKKHLEFIKNK